MRQLFAVPADGASRRRKHASGQRRPGAKCDADRRASWRDAVFSLPGQGPPDVPQPDDPAHQHVRQAAAAAHSRSRLSVTAGVVNKPHLPPLLFFLPLFFIYF